MFNKTILIEASLHRCNLSGQKFTECNLTKTQLNDSILTNCTFEKCDITDIIFTGANVENVNFIACKQDGKQVTLEWLKSRGCLDVEKIKITPFNIYNPKKLTEITSGYIIKDKIKFFKGLSLLPLDVINKFKELDVDYKRIFIRKSTAALYGIKFTPQEEETLFLKELYNALQEKNPYNSMHGVINKIDRKMQVGFFSQFKSNMEPLRNELVGLMKEYNSNKNQYNSQMNNI